MRPEFGGATVGHQPDEVQFFSGLPGFRECLLQGGVLFQATIGHGLDLIGGVVHRDSQTGRGEKRDIVSSVTYSHNLSQIYPQEGSQSFQCSMKPCQLIGLMARA